MKRTLCFFVMILLAIGPAAAVAKTEWLIQENAGGSPAYQEAMQLLEAGSLVDAMNALIKLGDEGDAAQYASYALAKLRLLRNDSPEAIKGFEDLGDFADSRWYKEAAQALSCHRYSDGSQFGYVDASGAMVVQAQFDWAERVFRADSLVPGGTVSPVAVVFKGTVECDGYDLLPKEGKYGLVRRDGTLAVPVEYDEILWTAEGLAAVRRAEGFWLYELASGQALCQAQDGMGGYGEDRVPVCKAGQWGYVDRTGTLLFDGYQWDSALPFSQGLAGVSLEGKAGFINIQGAVAIPLEYEAVTSFSEGKAGFLQKKRWGLIDKAGKVFAKAVYQEIGSYTQGFCMAKRGDKWGILDSKAKWLINNRYDEVTDFDPIYHRAWIRKNKLWGFIDSEGTVILKPAWHGFTPFGADGIAKVRYQDFYGYIDHQGVNRIPNMYEEAADFQGNLAGVALYGQVQYRNKMDNKVFDLPGNMPTEVLYGFIEGRKVQEHRETFMDIEKNEETETVSYTITFELYDMDGTRIEVK